MSKKFKFTVAERAILMQILPQESDYLTYKILRDLKSNIGFSEDELVEFEIVHKDGKMTWNRTKEKEKEITIGEKGLEIIENSLKRLNDEKKITDISGPLYERFMKS